MSENTETFRFPATHSQRALWYIEQSHPGNGAYDLICASRLTGELKVPALVQALALVTERHEALRSKLTEVDGQVWQEVAEHLAPDVSILQLASEEEAQQALEALAQAEFDLTRAPLLRSLIISLDSRTHVVAFKFHHVIVDQASIGIVVDEVEAAYAAFADGRPPSLPETDLDYADFAVFQAENKTRDALAPKLACWQEWLDEPVSCINLPTDHERAQHQSFEGRERFLVLPTELCERVRRYSQRNATTPFVTLLGAYATTLSMYAKQTRIVIGVPFANRADDEALERVVGLFINTLPLVVDMDWRQNFGALLTQINKRMLKVQSAQDVPLQYVAETAPMVRDPAYNPLYQVGFSLQPPAKPFAPQGLDATTLALHCGGSPYDLQTWVLDRGAEQNYELQIWYDSALYEAHSIDGFFDTFCSLLDACIDSDRPLCELSGTSDDSVRQFAQWQGEVRPIEHTNLARYVFSRERDWDAPALVQGDRTLSHRELKARALLYAQHFAKLGIGPRSRIGLLLPRNIDLFPILLGALFRGACYVPMDPRYPQQLLEHVVQDADLALLIASPDVDVPKGHEAPVEAPIPFDAGTTQRLADTLNADELLCSEPNPTAYTIYTSGSTGLPKGVNVPHRAVINLLEGLLAHPGIDAGDRMLGITTYAFDMSVPELYGPLSAGATLVLASREQAADAFVLAKLLREHDISLLQATPSSWRLLLDAAPDSVDGLTAWIGAEPLPTGVARDLLPRVQALWNFYGPTETTVWSTVGRIETAEAIAIGRPIQNTTLYVLDEFRRRVPPGVPGELYIGGEGVAEGYHNRAELTAERFTASPFVDGERIYQTGDLVRWLPDGRLQHLGRLDHQVKIRGFRVELGQIEAALSADERIYEAVALTREFAPGDHRLIAYVVPEQGVSVSANDLRRLLRTAVPVYMVPQFFMVLPELPRTPNGKLDRAALPDPAQTDTSQASAPQTPTEVRLGEIWADIVGVKAISRLDNFFVIGGHSLLAIRALSQVNEAFGTDVKLSAFISSSLAEIAQLIDVKLNDNSAETQLASPKPRRSISGFANKILGRSS